MKNGNNSNNNKKLSVEELKNRFNELLYKCVVEKRLYEGKMIPYDEFYKCDNETAASLLNEMVEGMNKYYATQDEIEEIKKQIDRPVLDYIGSKKELLSDEDEDFLEDKLNSIKDPVIIKIARIGLGMRKQYLEFYTGLFELLIDIKEGAPNSTRCQEIILEKIDKFAKAVINEYKYRFNKPYHINMGDILINMVQAIEFWEKNRYLGNLEWIKGRIRRQLKDYKKKKNKIIRNEIPFKPYILDSVDASELKAPSVNDNAKQHFLVEEAADWLGLSAQTLRNWDKEGLFVPEKKIIGNTEYRIYKYTDMKLLRKIKAEKEQKRGGVKEGLVSIGKLAKLLGISSKTLERKEKEGVIPKATRNDKGYRVYTLEDVRNIQKQLKITLEDESEE